MKWLRLYHDTTTDKKWSLVAADSGQPVGCVLAVWMEMLINASEATERGTLVGWDDRVIAAHLGFRTDAVAAIREAMQGQVLDGLRLTGWDKRQRSASDDAAERQRRARASKPKTPPNGTGGNGHAMNGAGHEPGGSVTEQSRDNSVHVSRDSEPINLECHVTASRATQTPDLEDSEAAASGAGAPGGGGLVLQMPEPKTLRGLLFGPVYRDLCAAISDKPEREIRSQLGKALSHLGDAQALALARQALLRAEPWNWLCKSISERIREVGKPAPGGGKVNPALERLKRREAEVREKSDLWGVA